jgi:hypothetical protein
VGENYRNRIVIVDLCAQVEVSVLKMLWLIVEILLQCCDGICAIDVLAQDVVNQVHAVKLRCTRKVLSSGIFLWYLCPRKHVRTAQK